MDNPYRSPTDLVNLVAESTLTAESDMSRIDLSGVVLLEDVVNLIRTPGIMTVMRVFAAITLLPFLALPIVMMIVDPASANLAVPVLAMVVVLISIFAIADRSLSRSRRAKRLVSKQPGCVGPLRGQLDAFGITFFNESANEFQRISWSAFPEVVVNQYGIRLDWRTEEGAFIAVPARLIESFDVGRMKSAIQTFRRNSNEPPIYESIPYWDLAPVGALRFQNTIPIFVQTALPIYFQWTGFLAMVLVVCSVLFFLDFDQVVAAILTIAVIVGVALYELGLKSHRASLSYRNWGWLDLTGCQSHLQGREHRFLWTDAIHTNLSPADLVVELDQDNEFTVRADDLLEGDWSTLSGWIQDQQSDD